MKGDHVLPGFLSPSGSIQATTVINSALGCWVWATMVMSPNLRCSIYSVFF